MSTESTGKKGAASVAPIFKHKTIAIVCGAPSSEMLAPFDDESWEIWVLGNRLDKHLGHRVTRIFEIHDDLSEHADPQAYAAWLAQHEIPMVVGEAFPLREKHIEVFPFEAARKLFGRTYLTSSSAYMMAYAILQGAEKIGVYGVDMAVDDNEYFWQRPCMEAWIGFAKGKGIDVRIHEKSPVLRSDFVEGRGTGGKPDFSMPPFTQAELLGMAKQHADMVEQIKAEIEQLTLKINAHDGARQAYERLAKVARAIEAGQRVTSLTEQATVR